MATEKVTRPKTQGKPAAKAPAAPRQEPVLGAADRALIIGVCDRISEALAHAQQSDDADLPDLLLPALGSLWSLRWSHQIHAGKAGAA